MTTPSRIAGFVLGLLAVFGAAWGAGAAFGPSIPAAAGPYHADAGEDHGGEHGPEAGPGEADSADSPGGLMVSDSGYTLTLGTAQVAASRRAPLRFTIVGPDGMPVKDYTRAHGKDLHLIVVGRDLTDFQHLHPTLDTTGTWSAPVDLSEPGPYRVFADVVPTARGASLTLGADLSVAGSYAPAALPAPTRTAEVDGYTVTLAGDLTAGTESTLTLSVAKDGRAVTDLDPYLEAYGHLVALRVGDLAYLHVHPDGEPADGRIRPGPDVVFHAGVPSPGRYRLFLDFSHGGVVRTAAFTVTAEGPR